MIFSRRNEKLINYELNFKREQIIKKSLNIIYVYKFYNLFVSFRVFRG